uniref:Uncharacterized protein n=1 Tax=Anguilla anguilla TaxID=7936 RepID=A0A0E9P6X2_ANGAN
MVTKFQPARSTRVNLRENGPAQWVKYFTKRRVYLKLQRQDARNKVSHLADGPQQPS